MSELNFNANDYEPTQEYTPLPNGQYVAVISESEVKPTKKGDGKLLELTLVIVEGEYANRKVWTRLNLVNRNPDAQRIANAHLSAICRAAGVMKTNDSSDLHNIPIRVTVVCKPRSDGNGLTNDITHFGPVNGEPRDASCAMRHVQTADAQKAHSQAHSATRNAQSASAPAGASQAQPGAGAAPWETGASSRPPAPPVAATAAGTPW